MTLLSIALGDQAALALLLLGALSLCGHVAGGIALYRCRKRGLDALRRIDAIESGAQYRQMQSFMRHVMDVVAHERELLEQAQKKLADERERVARLLNEGLR